MSENLFDKCNRLSSVPVTAQARAAKSDAAFETRSVQFVLKTLGMSKQESCIRREFKSLTGHSDLRFSVFLNLFQSFPIYLGTSRLRGIPIAEAKLTSAHYVIHKDKASYEASRYKAFQRIPFVIAYRAFQDASETAAAGKPIGLVVPRQGLGAGLIIHNEATERFWPTGLAAVFKTKKGERLYVQSFRDVVEAIRDSGWTPT